MPIHEKLPETLNLDGEWTAALARLYLVFKAAIIHPPLFVRGRRITCDMRKIEDSKEEGFWHVITKKDHTSGERLPDFPRAKRLCWLRPLLENHSDEGVKCWRYQEGSGKWRTYVWAEELDYVVVLEERGRASYYLITAYFVEREKIRESLRSKLRNGTQM